MLPPIPVDGITAEGVADLTEHVWKQMTKVFHEDNPAGTTTDTRLNEDKKSL